MCARARVWATERPPDLLENPFLYEFAFRDLAFDRPTCPLFPRGPANAVSPPGYRYGHNLNDHRRFPIYVTRFRNGVAISAEAPQFKYDGFPGALVFGRTRKATSDNRSKSKRTFVRSMTTIEHLRRTGQFSRTTRNRAGGKRRFGIIAP